MLVPAGIELAPETVNVEVAASVSTSTDTSVVPKRSSTVSPFETEFPLIWKLAMLTLVFAAATTILKL